MKHYQSYLNMILALMLQKKESIYRLFLIYIKV